MGGYATTPETYVNVTPVGAFIHTYTHIALMFTANVIQLTSCHCIREKAINGC